MARNWMGDYDPQNTTGWKEKGQVETWSPGGNGATTTTYNPPPSSGGPPRVLNPPPTIPKGRTHPGGIKGIKNRNILNWLKSKAGKYTGYTQHNINNELLKEALKAGKINENQYKRMGGYDVAQQLPAGIFDVPAVGIASGAYQLAKKTMGLADQVGLIDDTMGLSKYDKYGGAESMDLNMAGAAGLNPHDLQRYEAIVGGHQEVGGMLPGGHRPGASADRRTSIMKAGEGLYNLTHPNNQLANGGIASQGGRVPFQDAGLASLPYPEYYKLPPFSGVNPQIEPWTFPIEEEEIDTPNVIPASHISNTRGGDGGGGIGGLDLTYTAGAVPRGPTTDFNINPAAFLTGKGRLDPMGSDVDYFNTLSAPEKFNFGFQWSDVPGQKGYVPPSKYFQEPSLIDKGIGSIKDFFSGLGTKKVRGTLGTRLANQPRIPFPGAMASWSRSPFNKASPNYNENFVDQLNFLETQDNMIGRDSKSGLLRYGDDSVLAGKNVISLFGTNDYETMLNNYIQKMNANKKISDTAKAAKIAQAQEELAALLEKQKADRQEETPKWTPPSHHTEQGGGGYQDKAIHTADKTHSAPSKTGHMGPGGKHYNAGGLATMFTRRR